MNDSKREEIKKDIRNIKSTYAVESIIYVKYKCIIHYFIRLIASLLSFTSLWDKLRFYL